MQRESNGQSTSPFRRKVASFAAGATAALAAVLVTASWIDSRLSPTLEYHGPEAQRLADDMATLEELGITSDIAFLGTSMTGAAIDTTVIEEDLPHVDVANNVALPAARTPLTRRWLDDVVLPRLHPDKVVWGISAFELNPNRVDKPIDSYDSARATRAGWLGDADRSLRDLLVLSKRRDDLRDLASVRDALTDSAPDAITAPTGALANAVPLRWPMTPEGRDAQFQNVRNNALADFEVGDDELAELDATLDELTQKGIETVVVLLPVTDRYLDAHPGGVEEFEAALAAITESAEARGVPVLDLVDSADDSAFHDIWHMNKQGATEFSHLVAAELASMGW